MPEAAHRDETLETTLIESPRDPRDAVMNEIIPWEQRFFA